MKILIDTTQVPLARTGVGVYAERLVQELASIIASEDTLYLLVQDDDAHFRDLIAAHPNLRSLTIKSSLFRSRLLLFFYEQYILPWVLLYHRIDIVHSLHYTFPLLCPCSRVVTVHDLTFSMFPQMHTLARRLIMPFFTKMALRHAEGILFVSESTRKDAEKLFGVGNNQRNVTPLGVDSAAFSNVQPRDIEETLSRLEVDRPYILFLGTIEPRKNVTRLIQAFGMLGSQFSQYALVIAGKLGWDYESTLLAIDHSSQKARIRRLGFIAAADKIPLLAGCDLLVYPSLYEGFGLPVLEGMAAGVPVITGNLSSLPEVAGDAAVMIDPASVEQIAAAISTVLSDKAYSEKLREAGRNQSGKFTWKRTSEITYVAYKLIFQCGDGPAT